MNKDKPDSLMTEELRIAVSDQLREARRYAEVAGDSDLVSEAKERIEREARLRAKMADDYPASQREELQAAEQHYLISRICQSYEVLIGLGKTEDAAEVAKLVLKLDDGADTYNQLARAGYRTGKPTEENLAQARKAHELAKGQDVAILDILVRVLDARGRTGEACKLLQECAPRFRTEEERQTVAACVADLKCGG